MTCIAGYCDQDGFTIGADDRWSTDYVGRSLKTEKVYIVQNMYVIGVSGSVRAANLIGHAFDPGTIKGLKGLTLYDYMIHDFIYSLRECWRGGGVMAVENGVEKGPAQLLVGVGDRLFQVGSDMQVVEFIDGYDAIGSGAEVALGAFAALEEYEHPTATGRVVAALRAASRHARGVGDIATIVEKSPDGPPCITYIDL